MRERYVMYNIRRGTFYEKNGFYNFGYRLLDGDEQAKIKGKYLIQMLKYPGNEN